MTSSKWLCILITLDVMLLLHCSRLIPKSLTCKQLFPPNKIPNGAFATSRKIVQNKIVKYHNFFRTKVAPSASNMLKMTWDPLAASQAQRYAERCQYLIHNDPNENSVPNFGACGQNLFVSKLKTPWFFAIKSWFLEYRNFTYGVQFDDLKVVGHYTQMVWATSHQLGCGVALCPGGPWGQFYNYVCHYCPIGNYDGITQFPYKSGEPCDDCPNDCSDGLCTNPCPYRDTWSNCHEFLNYPEVCEKTCKASCTCGKTHIYKNYPFL